MAHRVGVACGAARHSADGVRSRKSIAGTVAALQFFSPFMTFSSASQCSVARRFFREQRRVAGPLSSSTEHTSRLKTRPNTHRRGSQSPATRQRRRSSFECSRVSTPAPHSAECGHIITLHGPSNGCMGRARCAGSSPAASASLMPQYRRLLQLLRRLSVVVAFGLAQLELAAIEGRTRLRRGDGMHHDGLRRLRC